MASSGPSRVRARSAWLLLWIFAAALFMCGPWSCRRTPSGPPRLGQVGAFSLIDQGGAPVTAESLRGKVWVAAFFFSRCPSICPKITRRMRALQVAANGSGLDLLLVSFSVDPDNDTPPVLLDYSRRFQADLQNWHFLTGELAEVKRTVLDGFKLALDGKSDSSAENGGIIHGSHLVLVDRSLGIRGYYRSDDEDDMARILVDAGRL